MTHLARAAQEEGMRAYKKAVLKDGDRPVDKSGCLLRIRRTARSGGVVTLYFFCDSINFLYIILTMYGFELMTNN